MEASNGIYLARNDQLQSQANSLISADQKKDEFLAVLAHELRGPLSAMATAGKLLEKGAYDPERIIRMGQTITRQTAHMTRLVEDLLDVSRIVRNEISIEKKAVDLREAIIDALEQLAPSAQHRMHHVAAHLPDNPVMVSGDRTRLIQVLGNLIGNSIRYTPDGGKITVTLHNDANGIHVKVKDNGIGIAAEKIPSLFDLFVQVQRSTDSRNSGLGLGLALVKALMEAHQGSVTVYSAGLGLGSQFDILFPTPESPRVH